MKRAGSLAEKVLERDNLLLAFHKAARGKRDRTAVRSFACDLDHQIDAMACALADGSFAVGNFSRFTVRDPKERIIHAAAFLERVMHHALMNVCEAALERVAIHDSYACRRGKGSLAAVKRGVGFSARNAWFLKMDVHKFFDSIDHQRLQELLGRRIKDRWILDWFDRLIGAYKTNPGRGLPIGSLTSQHLANFYLWPLDRFIKEELKASSYLRYMDDFVVWSHDKALLLDWKHRIEAFLQENLQLHLRGQAFINRTALGMDFLGYRVFPHGIALSRANLSRMRRRWKGLRLGYAAGFVAERDLQRGIEAITAFAGHADQGHGQERIFYGRRPEEATSASTAAAPGTTRPGTVGHPTATTTRLTTATTTSASALLEDRPCRCHRLPGREWAEPGRRPDRRKRMTCGKRVEAPGVGKTGGAGPKAPGA